MFLYDPHRGQEGEGGVRVGVEFGRRGPGREEAGVAAARGRAGARQIPAIYIQSGVLFLPLCPPILEPDFHL